jgi:hypothetical protein
MNIFQYLVWVALQHPPYSPDLNPCDCDLTPKLKQLLSGKMFANREGILTAVWFEVGQIIMSGNVVVFATFTVGSKP